MIKKLFPYTRARTHTHMCMHEDSYRSSAARITHYSTDSGSDLVNASPSIRSRSARCLRASSVETDLVTLLLRIWWRPGRRCPPLVGKCPMNPLGLIRGGVGHAIHAIGSLDSKRRGGTRRRLRLMATYSLPLVLPLFASTSPAPQPLSSLAMLGHWGRAPPTSCLVA